MKERLQRLLAVILCVCVLASLLASPALANNSTTTYDTAAKDLSANTEIFAITKEAYDDYPYYGALWEPQSGVYYGRVCDGGPLSFDTWGTVNAAEQADESATSTYYSLTDDYSLEYWSYLYAKVLADGEHAFLVILNFEQEAGDCQPTVDGAYDAKLIQDFTYLSQFEGPLFLRIGGEVNVWENKPQTQAYIAAFRHIAALARTYCPNVALVYSPNYSSGFGIDMDSYYPGDDVVDWIGASLYYNQYAMNWDNARDEFYGVGVYGDAVVNIQQVVNLSRMHQKPVIITEGGTARVNRDINVTYTAAERLERAYTYLTMVYPEIKCLILSDTNFNEVHEQFSVYDSPTMTAAYNQAVTNNPTLLHRYQDSAKYYTRLSSYPVVWEGIVALAAYSYADHKLSASWYLDGVRQTTLYSYPYRFALNVDSLSEGWHMIGIWFSNGGSQYYWFYRGDGSEDAEN